MIGCAKGITLQGFDKERTSLRRAVSSPFLGHSTISSASLSWYCMGKARYTDLLLLALRVVPVLIVVRISHLARAIHFGGGHGV